MIGEAPTKLDGFRQRFGLTGEARSPQRHSFRPAGFRLEPHVELATGPEARLAWVELVISFALLQHPENQRYAFEVTEAFLRLLHGGAGLDVGALLAVPDVEKPLSEGRLKVRKLGETVSLVVLGPDAGVCGNCGHPGPLGAGKCPMCEGPARQSWWQKLRRK